MFCYQIYGEIDVFLRLGLGFLDHVVNDRLQIEGLLIQDQFLVLQFGDGEELIDECQQMVGLTFDDGEILLFNLRLVIHLSTMQETVIFCSSR